jgi:hemoglobin
MPFAVTQAARDRWMLLMDIALKQTALPPDAEQHVRHFFEGMSTFMINRADQGAQQ